MNTTQLTSDGFEFSGKWQLVDGEADFHLDNLALAMQANVLYAFVCNDEVKYIGQTKQKLCCRMCNYQKKLHSQSAAKKREVHNSLRLELAGGRLALIFARFCPRNELSAQENKARRKFDPAWNGGEK